MNFNKFTIKAQEAIQEAVNMARANGQQVIEPVHIMGGVLKSNEQIVSFLLQKTGDQTSRPYTLFALFSSGSIVSLPKTRETSPYLL